MNLLLSNDHKLFSEGFAILLESAFDNSKVHQANSWIQVYKHLKTSNIDLAFIDLQLPSDKSWVEELSVIRKITPDLPICLLSGAMAGFNLRTAYEQGVRGYLNKSLDIDGMKKTVNHLLSGGVSMPDELWDGGGRGSCIPLTPRQVEVLGYIHSGNSNREIANKMALSECTIKRHLSNIYDILGVKSRFSALHESKKFGLFG